MARSETPTFSGPARPLLAAGFAVAAMLAPSEPVAGQSTPETSFLVELDVRGVRGGTLPAQRLYEAFEIKVRYVAPPQEALNPRRDGMELVQGRFPERPGGAAGRASVFLAALEIRNGRVVSGSRSAAFDVVAGQTRRVDPRLLSNSEALSGILSSTGSGQGDGNLSVVQARGAVLLAPSVGSGTFWSRTAAGSGATWIASPISWFSAPAVGSGEFWSGLPRDWTSRDGVYLIALPADPELQPNALAQPVLVLAEGRQ